MANFEHDHMAFEHAPVGLVLSERRVIKSCNVLFATMFGYNRDALIGQSFRILYESDQDFENIRDIGLGQLRAGLPYCDERLMTHKDGSAFWCRFRASTLEPHDPLLRVVLSFALIDTSKPSTILTKRERQVIVGLKKGRTSKQIARDLDLSHRTIEDVRARLLKKFSVKNSMELLSFVVGV